MSINKAVLYLFLACAVTARHHDLDREADAGPPEPGADRGRGRLRPDLQADHQRQHARRDRGQVVPVRRHAVLLHLVLEHDRLHPAADEHARRPSTSSGSSFPAFALYAATANLSVPLVLTLVVWVSYQIEGIRSHGVIGYLKSWLPAGVTGFAVGPHLRHRGHLAVRADHLAVGATVREHPGRPPADPVHGRRARGAARDRRARLGHAPDRDRLLPLRGRPDRDPAGLHLRHAHIHLPRRGNAPEATKEDPWTCQS